MLSFPQMIRYQLEAAKLLSEELSPLGMSRDQVLQLLERPQKEEHGDIAFPCFQVAKTLKKSPMAISQELASKLNGKSTAFEAVLNTGPYLNFKLSKEAAFSIAKKVFEQKESYGFSDGGKGQKILIEYSSPNVAKELHIGHFRNTILGQSLNNIYRATGHTTISINHLGDWGSQFGRVAYGYLKYGDESEMKKNPIEYLMKLYIKVSLEEESNPEIDREARLLFKKIEEKEPEMTKLWKRFCDLSIDGLKIVYERLGVSFDHYIGESFYFDKIPALLKELKDKNLLELSEGAQVVSMGEDAPPCLIVTSDGTSLYATRDIAAAIWRHKEFAFDRCLYVVGSEQQLHLKQVFTVLGLMGFPWAKTLEHVSYGLYRFKDGKFSTRKGKIILAEEVLNESREKALNLIEEKNPNLPDKLKTAEIVGVGAVIFNDLSTDRNKDVEFDWDRILDFEGDTGPYLQYSYARACSILRTAEQKGYKIKCPENSSELSSSEAALSLMKQFGRLEGTIVGACRLNKPSIIANYALDLAKSFNVFYRHVKVLDQSPDVPEKLGMVWAFRQALRNTLELLCMKVPEEM